MRERDTPVTRRRRLPVGAECVANGVDFRLWAPDRSSAAVLLELPGGIETLPLEREPDGYFRGRAAELGAGLRYRLRVDDGPPQADPASRYQPEGPFGPSQVVDPTAFAWTDHDWRGVAESGLVLYELHVGSFTAEGDWAAAQRELPRLAALGVTVLEVMPVAEFPGAFGWGYDGVNHYAPYHGYGTPEDFRRFVDAAHGLGLAVILDWVANHYGPAGNPLPAISSHYLGRRGSDWGDSPNFDGPGCAGVREYFEANAGYWIDEFHLDGLRLDATQAIVDDSPEHVLRGVVRQVRLAAGARRTLVIAENEAQHVDLLRPFEQGGVGCDALWNDDFHHSARVALTGRREAYYRGYAGTPQELVSALKRGYLYQGQYSPGQRQRHGTPAWGLPPRAFVHYLENHDQVSNSATGARLQQLAAPAAWRALTALLLLGPQTPLLFQGQEYGSSRPFRFFADHSGELAAAVRKGRAQFLAQFPPLADAGAVERLPDPADPASFAACRLDARERLQPASVAVERMVRELLRLRREDPVISGARSRGLDGAVLGPQAFVLRWFSAGLQEDRLLLLNLGADLDELAAEPLLAPPAGQHWQLAWSSEDPRYGGAGIVAPETAQGWRLPAQCALLLQPQPRQGSEVQP